MTYESSSADSELLWDAEFEEGLLAHRTANAGALFELYSERVLQLMQRIHWDEADSAEFDRQNSLLEEVSKLLPLSDARSFAARRKYGYER